MTGGLVTALVTALEERSAGGAGAAELAPERRPGGQIGGSRAGARQAAVARSPRDERLFGASGDGMANGGGPHLASSAIRCGGSCVG